MSKIEFKNYTTEIRIHDNAGTCDFNDAEGNRIAYSRGVSLAQRYLTLKSEIDDFECIIIPKSRKEYVFARDKVIFAVLTSKSPFGFSNLTYQSNYDRPLTFKTHDMGRNYLIGQERIHIGIISKTDITSNVTSIRIMDDSRLMEVISVVTVIEYFGRTSILSTFG